ncbi:MAG: glycosyltransferase family A protein [Candidatus Alcyoniella australis]|nr:glycosyltransferase family A protein [Candidatus Alcyoniella australis]
MPTRSDSERTVTVLIPCRDGAGALERCLRSVAAQRAQFNLQILVVDDGSRDSSAAIARELGAQVHSIEPAGRAAALNAGLEHAKGDPILFTDADCEVPPDWAAKLCEHLDQRPELHGVGGNLWPSARNPSELSKLLPYLDEFASEQELDPAERRTALNANNMALRASALRNVGGFDAGLLHGADADLTRRMLAAGSRLMRVLQPRVRHLKRDGLSGLCRTSYRRGSTVAVHLKSAEFGWTDVLRGFVQPLSFLVRGYAALPRLRGLLPDAPFGSALLAPWAGCCARMCEALGRLRYFVRYHRGSGR